MKSILLLIPTILLLSCQQEQLPVELIFNKNDKGVEFAVEQLKDVFAVLDEGLEITDQAYEA